MTHFLVTALLFLFGSSSVLAQNEYIHHPVDILEYAVSVKLNDNHDTILGQETITFTLKVPCDSFFIDLKSVTNGKGMRITSPVKIDDKVVQYRHANNRIWIQSESTWKSKTLRLDFAYEGIPETGLIIGENKFGNRTYFGDNWPDRAHHWFACVDHPSEKAKVNFTIWAPSGMECIATGALASKTSEKSKYTKYVFQSNIDLPTKVMVIGVADFKVKEYTSELDFPVSAWVYPKDKKKGFNDMEISVQVANFFIQTIGAYPYEKLANVQSTTQFGGMENAGNIFYDEKAVKGDGSMEALIAHEIAHQWFGNSASELDWPHIWLSEGFATYFTDIYWEHTHGTDAMNERLIGERNRVIGFSKRYLHPVVDTSYESLMHLLNPNSYQKGAWILHMLRTKIGDDAFFKGIRTYYDAFQYSNATTSDLQEHFETASGQDLQPFFEQWLFTAGHPILHFKSGVKHGGWEYLTIEQQQEGAIFSFDLEVEVLYQDGTSEIFTIPVNEKEVTFNMPTKKEISGFKYDPNTLLLFEEVAN